MTNYEKIKQMTAEEIAEWWGENMECEDCIIARSCIVASTAENCKKVFKQWLESEVKDNEK